MNSTHGSESELRVPVADKETVKRLIRYGRNATSAEECENGVAAQIESVADQLLANLDSIEPVSEWQQALDALRWVKYPIPSDGFVCLVDAMGDEAAIVQAARVSYGEGTKTPSDDRTLLRYLMRHRHTTPLEMVELKFMVRVPMDTWRQWIRHRTACLAGDVSVVFNRPCDGRAYRMTMKELYDKFNGNTGGNSSHVDRVQNMQLRSVDEVSGNVITTRVVDIWESGVKQVFRITVDSGRSIRCSSDHRILTPRGWTTCKQLRVGDVVTTVTSRKGLPAPVWNDVDPETEEWMPIVGWEDWYQISDQGRVRRIVGGRGSRSHGRCKARTESNHRSVTSLNRPGEQVLIQVHREMLRAFQGEPATEDLEACHGDGNPLNNVLSNLRWGTSAENKQDMIDHGHSTSLCAVPQVITEIVADGVEMTYDLEVSGPWHNFSANDIVVHNSVNEYSTRYSVAIDAQHATLPGEWRLQSQTNKQGSGEMVTKWPDGWTVTRCSEQSWLIEAPANAISVGRSKWYLPQSRYPDSPTPGDLLTDLEAGHRTASTVEYRLRLALGVAREQARKDLPLSTYTEAYWKIDLHNLLHFLGLRMDSHAQLEIRQYANALGDIVERLYPQVWQAFRDYRLESRTLSGPEVRVIQNLVAAGAPFPAPVPSFNSCVWPREWAVPRCRERDEAILKLQDLAILRRELGSNS